MPKINNYSYADNVMLMQICNDIARLVLLQPAPLNSRVNQNGGISMEIELPLYISSALQMCQSVSCH